MTRPPPPPFAELVAATHFSFLRGAAHPCDMVGHALDLGHSGIGIADRNSVAGVVRAHLALREARKKHADDATAPARTGENANAAEARRAAAAEASARHDAFRLVVGARLVFADGTPDIVAYPATRRGWGRLTRLLTTGNRRAEKGSCILRLPDLLDHLGEMLLIVLPGTSFDPVQAVPHRAPPGGDAPAEDPRETRATPPPIGPGEGEGSGAQAAPRLHSGRTEVKGLHLRTRDGMEASNDSQQVSGDPPPDMSTAPALDALLARLARAAPGQVWLGITMNRDGRDRRRLARLAALADAAGVPILATCDALYAHPGQRPLHDVLRCIRLGTTLDAAGRRLEANAERHLKPAEEMARLFRDRPDAVAAATDILGRIAFTLDELAYEYPHEPVPDGWNPQAWLEHLTTEAARARYGDAMPAKLRKLLDEEFALIAERKYAYYFLTVHDIVKFAREQEPPILCQGRGSAANSAVCYLLGITSVDPMKYDLLFSRFVSSERDEPPDIDVDFEHERREEVMQYVYRRYGRHRAGIAATVIHYRPRSAIREVGKVLGFSEDMTSRLSATVWGSFANGFEEARYAEAGMTLDNPHVARLRLLVDEILSFPRHLSQHVGGFVLTHDRLDETVPILNGAMPGRTFIEWDKDDIDALGLMKVDVLALGMLTCLAKGFDLIAAHEDRRYTLDSIPDEDAGVYDMLCTGDSIGVFQVESRAQINMLPRLKPREFYDLAIQVAIVRPGPIEGDMVHPYLRRRDGRRKDGKKIVFPRPHPDHGPADELESVLGKTLGVPLFQEQAMKLAIVAARFTPGEANRLRRAMATFRQRGGMGDFEQKMVGTMVARGYERDFAERCFRQIEGFGSYGFPESHALAFGRLVYVSAWMKCRHPAAFACALLNAQPMGFYAPAQIVADARAHGVPVLPCDVAASGWDNRLERDAHGTLGVRLGFRQIDGFRTAWGKAIEAARAGGRFESLEDLARRAHLPARALRLLADGDACRSLGQSRRPALWEARRIASGQLPLFAAADARELGREADAHLPPMPLSEEVAADYQTTRLSLKGHPMAFLRPLFRAEGVASAAGIGRMRNGQRARAAGVVLVRQRPGKGNAIFVTIEDETGIVNVLIWARLFERLRRPIMAARLMLVEGEIQKSPEGVIHLMGSHVDDRTAELGRLSQTHAARVALSRADCFVHPQHPRGGHGGGGGGDGRGSGTGHRHPRDVRVLPKSRDFR